MAWAYYNEIEPFAAAWLRELITRGLIAPGEVDTRSIVDVQPDDIKGFTQCHFFAGIGGWSYALRLAGWPDDRPVWTGSCPCQPYSAASVAHGGAKGQSDERDLWPVFFSFLHECRPNTIFGEQVDKAISWGWWDRAAMDLEGATYAAAASVLRADAYGGAHQRKRLYWLANSCRKGRKRREPVQFVPVAKKAPLAQHGYTAVRARRALDGDFSNLLSDDGVSVVMERRRIHGYGNAIHIGSAIAFIQAAQEAVNPAQIAAE